MCLLSMETQCKTNNHSSLAPNLTHQRNRQREKKSKRNETKNRDDHAEGIDIVTVPMATVMRVVVTSIDGVESKLLASLVLEELDEPSQL